METLATVASLLMVIVTFPISIFYCFKVSGNVTFSVEHRTQYMADLIYGYISFRSPQIVQEYERAVIFRLGRLREGNARGPGMFFIIPCVDNYTKVDLRTVSFDVPPQEVNSTVSLYTIINDIGSWTRYELDCQRVLYVSHHELSPSISMCGFGK